MLTFAVAAGVTAALGFIVKRFPIITLGLDGFARWAGLFMQIAGVIEALRRLVHMDNPFSIATAMPTVSFVGGPTVGAQNVRVSHTPRTPPPTPPQQKKSHIEIIPDDELPDPLSTDERMHLARFKEVMKAVGPDWVALNQPQTAELINQIDRVFSLEGHANPITGEIDPLEFMGDTVAMQALHMRERLREWLAQAQEASERLGTIT